MKTMSKVVMSAAVAAVVVLSGCAGPDVATMKAADYGPYPADYQAVIADYHAHTLKDPESARVQYLGGPVKGYIKANPIARDATYGYLVCMDVNAKNSFGGYTGNERTAVFIRDGKVMRYVNASAGDDVAAGMVKSMCANVIGHTGEGK